MNAISPVRMTEKISAVMMERTLIRRMAEAKVISTAVSNRLDSSRSRVKAWTVLIAPRVSSA